MSDAVDFIQDTTTGLFDFATTPLRAVGSALFPSPNLPGTPAATNPQAPVISDVQRRRDLLRRQAASGGRRSLILTRRRPGDNTGMRPRGGASLGGGEA
jgi:hypothetical protein